MNESVLKICGALLSSFVAFLLLIAVWIDNTTEPAGKVLLTAVVLGCWGFVVGIILWED